MFLKIIILCVYVVIMLQCLCLNQSLDDKFCSSPKIVLIWLKGISEDVLNDPESEEAIYAFVEENNVMVLLKGHQPTYA